MEEGLDSEDSDNICITLSSIRSKMDNQAYQ